jgi:hypothetical protein
MNKLQVEDKILSEITKRVILEKFKCNKRNDTFDNKE